MGETFKKIFLIFLVAFLGFLAMTFYIDWQAKRWQKSLREIGPPIFEPPKFEPQKEITFPSEKETAQKEFISDDGKLIFRYPGDWEEGNLQNLESPLPKEDFQPLFFAQKINFEKTNFASLLVFKITLGNKTPEEIFQEAVEKFSLEKEKIKITKLEKKDGEIIFEGYQEGMFGYNIFIKGKLLFAEENKGYFIVFTIIGKDWQLFEKDIKDIFDSLKLLK